MKWNTESAAKRRSILVIARPFELSVQDMVRDAADASRAANNVMTDISTNTMDRLRRKNGDVGLPEKLTTGGGEQGRCLI